MYSWELYKFLEERDYHLTPLELYFITDIEKHSQLNHIKYDAYNNYFQMWDVEGNYFQFTSQNYDEWEKQGKPKTLSKRRNPYGKENV